MNLISFRLYGIIYLTLSLVFCFAVFCVTREAVESLKAEALIERYAANMEIILSQSTEWLYQKIAELCNKIVDSDSVEGEIKNFNEQNRNIFAYWIKQDQDSRVFEAVDNELSGRISIGRSLLQMDFESNKGKPILPITIVVKGSKNAGLLLFHFSLEDMYEAMKYLVKGEQRIQIAILKENNEVLLSVNLDRKVDFNSIKNNRLIGFFNLMKGKYSRGIVTRPDNSLVSVYYFYTNDVGIFPVAGFRDFLLLCCVWFIISFFVCIVFGRELSKLLKVILGEEVGHHFYLREFYELHDRINSLLEKLGNHRHEMAKCMGETSKLKELNNIYALERINVNAVLDELTAEKEILLIDKMVLEEKIDYLKRKVEKNAE